MQALIAGAVLVLAACAVLAAAGVCCLAKWDGRGYSMLARPRAAQLAAAPSRRQHQRRPADHRHPPVALPGLLLDVASRRPVLRLVRTLPGSSQRRPRNPVAERREVTGMDKRDIPAWLKQVVDDAVDGPRATAERRL